MSDWWAVRIRAAYKERAEDLRRQYGERSFGSAVERAIDEALARFKGEAAPVSDAPRLNEWPKEAPAGEWVWVSESALHHTRTRGRFVANDPLMPDFVGEFGGAFSVEDFRSGDHFELVGE